jgi:hypothetical protein
MVVLIMEVPLFGLCEFAAHPQAGVIDLSQKIMLIFFTISGDQSFDLTMKTLQSYVQSATRR